MTKKVKVLSVLSGIISQLFTFALLALGVALLVPNFTDATMLGVLADINACYAIVAEAVGIEAWIIVAITTLLPAVLIEIFALVQIFSPKIEVDKTAIALTVIIMEICCAGCVVFALTLASSIINYPVVVGIILALLLLQIIFALVIFACTRKKRIQQQKLEEQAEADKVDTAVEESSSSDEESADEGVESPAEEPAEEEIEDDTVIEPQSDSSTAEVLSDVYDKGGDAPLNNAVLSRIDKIVDYKNKGYIFDEECDMLCISILHEDNDKAE